MNLKGTLNLSLNGTQTCWVVEVAGVHSGMVVEIRGSQLDEGQGNTQEKTEKNVYMLSISILNSKVA